MLGLLGALLTSTRGEASGQAVPDQSRAFSAARALAVGVLVLLLVSGPLLTVANYLTTSSFFDLRPRYGFPLLPAMLACAGAVFAGRTWRRVFVALAGAMTLLVLAQAAWVGVFPAPVAA